MTSGLPIGVQLEHNPLSAWQSCLKNLQKQKQQPNQGLSGQDYLKVGKITSAFGLHGWVKVFSYTDPIVNIINYSPWRLVRDNEVQEVEVITGKPHGKLIVVRLSGVNSRDQAETLCGWEILVKYSQLPKTAAEEYYWADLVGLSVVTVAGDVLGKVDYLLETGANDVLVVKGERERLIPFLQGNTVINIDLDTGVMIVDWDPEF